MKNVILFFIFSSLFFSCSSPQQKESVEVVMVEEEVKEMVVEEEKQKSINMPYDTYIRNTERGKVLVVDNDMVLFYHAETNMYPDYQLVFNQANNLLELNTNITLILEGHANRVGSAYSYNYELSKRRSEASYEYFLSIGADTNRLIITYLGEALPEYNTLSENRRLEFIIIENENDLKKYNDFVKTLNFTNNVDQATAEKIIMMNKEFAKTNTNNY